MKKYKKFPSDELRSRFQRILDEHTFQGIIGATMAVSVPSYEDMSFFSGMADLENNVSMRNEHLLMIGSNTKTFICCLFLQLVQEGKIHIDDTIDKWFPNLPNAKFISIRQVLTQLSGIPDYFDYALEGNPPSDSLWTSQDIIDRAYSINPVRAPGEFEYSNTNFVILSMIVEKETGESRAVEIRKRFIEPLGLDSTYTASDEEYPKQKLARGYAHDTGFPVDATHSYPISLAGPAGDMVSTADDLLNWLNAIFSGKIIEEPCLSYISKVQVKGTYPGTAMSGAGFGSLIFTYNDLEVIGYRGGIHGYISIMGHELKHGVSAVILTNSYHPDRDSYFVAGLDRPFEAIFRTALAALR
jgi:D-alanyl-D-alanine carboxypeptidase